MKKLILRLLLLLPFFVGHYKLYAQEEQQPAIRVSGVSLSTGALLYEQPFLGLEFYKALAPESALLESDFKDYHLYSDNAYWASAFRQASVYLKFRDKAGELKINKDPNCAWDSLMWVSMSIAVTSINGSS